MRIQPLTNELALSFGLPKARGALISNIEPNSAGSKAGIQPGDVITHVNALEVAHADDLPRMVARHQPGAKIKLTVVRGGKTQQVEATLDPLLDDPDDEPSPTPGSKPPRPSPRAASASRSTTPPAAAAPASAWSPRPPSPPASSCPATSSSRSTSSPSAAPPTS